MRKGVVEGGRQRCLIDYQHLRSRRSCLVGGGVASLTDKNKWKDRVLVWTGVDVVIRNKGTQSGVVLDISMQEPWNAHKKLELCYPVCW